ncbi:hypothetical protein [Saccharopolyspora phatthalungensis]|uniref:Uncharacterized protein n=1 Tax=Saccharopolyspora phatthalungensis TaxID=664693 RepID=A0A840Q0Q6_9PSEU|nr:hypothetical protein [Saccharopolyspora phatthalungensis]MBB5156112.1 hypothetical protein [Saccharopolyspora phatthalungensis]
MTPGGALLGLAIDVPVSGREADDWRARNMAELLLAARTSGDPSLVSAVDDFVSALPPVYSRFADRLRRMRGFLADAPANYVRDRIQDPAPPWPRPAVRARAVQLARFVDGCAPEGWDEQQSEPANAAEVSAELDRNAPTRVLGRTGHRCRDTDLPAELVWREWLVDNDVPTLIVVQFGEGLVVAEAVAMACEFIALADTGTSALYRESLRRLAINRLRRLPWISEWGARMLPGSPTMAQVVRSAAVDEFAALPALAEAYIAGPFDLADRGFDHPLIPPVLRSALVEKFQIVRSH